MNTASTPFKAVMRGDCLQESLSTMQPYSSNNRTFQHEHQLHFQLYMSSSCVLLQLAISHERTVQGRQGLRGKGDVLRTKYEYAVSASEKVSSLAILQRCEVLTVKMAKLVLPGRPVSALCSMVLGTLATLSRLYS